MGKVIEQDRLDKEREKTEETIMRLLAKDKNVFIRKCQYCGAPIPLSSSSRMCDVCYAEMKAHRIVGESSFGKMKRNELRGDSGKKKESRGGGQHRRYHRRHGDS